MKPKSVLAAAVGVLLAGAATAALAWGSMGHREIGVAAMHRLPAELPAFLRTEFAAVEVGELAREPDRWKDSGKVHDTDREPAHFVNLDDQAHVFEGPSIDQLPATREAYDTGLHASGKQDMTTVGWLPYALVDNYQQLAKDFAYWRVDSAAEASAKTPERKAWFTADRVRREALILRDIGEFGHYVGDGSQPLHVSIHFNGWGKGLPNPEGYTLEHIHARFEGALVHQSVTQADVEKLMRPYQPCTAPIEVCVATYLKATLGQVEPLYRLEKAGGLQIGDPRGHDFASARLADGASELRDLITDAWRASETLAVGWPKVTLKDVLAGADPYDSLYGKD
jgi:hypothetical protein